MNKPKISIVVPVYNREDFIAETIESVLNQTFKDFELIIVDDDSTDNTKNIVQSFFDQRIKYFHRKKMGYVLQLNYGIQVAQGDYIARIDSDDIMLPDRLKKQINFLEENNLVMCGSFAYKINKDNEIIGSIENMPIISDDIKKSMSRINPFIHPAMLIKRSIFKEFGLYKNKWMYAEDYELWIRISQKYKIGNIPEKLIKYREHNNQVTYQKKYEMIVKGLLLRYGMLNYYRLKNFLYNTKNR